MVPDLRREEILRLVKNNGVVFMKDLARGMGISLSTVRRDLVVMEQEGNIVILRGGAVKCKTEECDETVPERTLTYSEEDRNIAERAASFVEDGDCIYVDSGTITAGMFNCLQGRKITIVSGGIEMLDNLPVKSTKCILLGGEVQKGQKSILGALTEKMISDMHFDKAFISADGYIPGDAIYTYDEQEARKKVVVKNHSEHVYVLMNTCRKNKFAFCKVFGLGDVFLITDE